MNKFIKIQIILSTLLLHTNIKAICQTTTPSDESGRESNDKINHQYTFSKIDVDAEFIGGLEAWQSFLNHNLNPSIPTDKGCPAGMYTVVVRFIVDKNGFVSQIVPETNFGFGMENEVIRVMKLSPKWKPASQNGRKVNSYKRQPISFLIEEDKQEKKIENQQQ